VGTQWPDYRAAIAAVESQQLALRRTGTLANFDIAEEANTDAFVRTLVELAESLQTSPAELREGATTSARLTTVALPRFDSYAAPYGLRVGLGTTISYLIAMVANTPELFNVLFHPAFLAVSSYGATIRRAGTRFAGTVVGCLVAIVATIAVMPNISEVSALALLVLAVTVPSAHVAVGGPRFSYVGVQIVVAFAIVALAERPLTDVHVALWRVYGTLLGPRLSSSRSAWSARTMRDANSSPALRTSSAGCSRCCRARAGSRSHRPRWRRSASGSSRACLTSSGSPTKRGPRLSQAESIRRLPSLPAGARPASATGSRPSIADSPRTHGRRSQNR
jgi:uncharacterized membrane protein YccC